MLIKVKDNCVVDQSPDGTYKIICTAAGQESEETAKLIAQSLTRYILLVDLFGRAQNELVIVAKQIDTQVKCLIDAGCNEQLLGSLSATARAIRANAETRMVTYREARTVVDTQH